VARFFRAKKAATDFPVAADAVLFMKLSLAT